MRESQGEGAPESAAFRHAREAGLQDAFGRPARSVRAAGRRTAHAAARERKATPHLAERPATGARQPAARLDDVTVTSFWNKDTRPLLAHAGATMRGALTAGLGGHEPPPPPTALKGDSTAPPHPTRCIGARAPAAPSPH
ncbi:hypothetical protein ACFVT2_18660 [Streptomyces sp. NPDC058000]|uniref:hypothetical protein n=1 Tax=Streptomyces sp. NPDC058000 TaxID=3346299 RepID=UPI0036E449CA